MLNLDTSRYAWANTYENLTWTVAVVSGRNRDEVIRAYGGDPTQEPQSLTFSGAWIEDEQDFGLISLVQLRDTGEHIVAIENNGWVGADSAVVERASLNDAHAFCIYWNLDSRMHVYEARDGVLLADFEPAFARGREDWSDPHGELFPDWAPSVPWEAPTLNATLLAIMEQQTGLAFDRAWLDEPAPTYRIPYPGASGAGKSSPAMV